MNDPVTPLVRRLLDDLAGLGLPPLHTLTPEQAREMRKAAADLAGGGEREHVASVVDHAIAGPGGPRPVRTYVPAGWPEDGPSLVYFHGGGWVLGDLDTHDAPCRGLANTAGLRVMSVDYRRAPEHPWPAALDDAWAALRWMAGAATGPVLVGGDSAGGHMAACMAVRARDAGLALSAQVLVYPVVDLASFGTPSYEAFADGYWLTRAAMGWFRDHFVPGGADPRDPDISPRYRKDLSGLAPAIVVAAECDVLVDEGRAYARLLERAGCPVEYLHFQGVIHGFWAMPGVVPEGRRAIEDVAAALSRVLPRRP